MLLPLLLACAPKAPPVDASAEPAPAPVPVLVAADPRPAADGLTELADLRVGERVTPVTFWPLARTGQVYGDGPPWGTLVDQHGAPLVADGKPVICENPDYVGVLEAHGKTWMLNHFECSPSAIYLSELQPAAGGAWTITRSRPIPAPGDGAFNELCSGDITPWNTLLSGEEYETDAPLLVDGRIPESVPGKQGRMWDYSEYPEWARFLGEGARPSPYGNGWVVETELLDADGGTRSTKRLAMGRFSHELGLVMPDRRTVYLTDDGSHGIFAMFVADRPGDLRAGRLYLAKLAWQGELAIGEPVGIEWLDAGHADEDTLRQALTDGLAFDDLFERRPLDETCTGDWFPHRAPQSVDQCLRLKDGQEQLASRFETRRFAARLGATTELEKSEGLALDEDRRQLYLALTRFKSGTLAGDPPFPGRDHIRLPRQACGAVLRLALGSVEGIDSPWVATGAVVALAGSDPGSHEATDCVEPGIAEPDNITWAPGLDRLLIAEDTDRAPNRLWAWGDDGLVPLVAAPGMPPDGRMAEVSGLSWVVLDGQGYATVAIQHAGGQPALIGLVGPFPVQGTGD
ncbi:MAG: DUF839 domain-containing protein [Alphaproteobacteria bacterium]|nr:DUF839 domain-containing protein [Alphaproteobacteria bacterium]